MTAGEYVRIISVDGTGDAAAEANNIGGAGETITISIKVMVVSEMIDA